MIDILNPILQQRIHTVAHGDDDIASGVTLALLEKSNSDPRFAEQSVGYWIKRAAWKAKSLRTKSLRTKSRVYDSYVCVEPYTDSDDGEHVSIFDELIPSSDPGPEALVIASQTAAELSATIGRLPAVQQQIARLLLGGYKTTEIAAELRLSKSNVCHITARMRKTLAAAIT